MNVLTVNLLLSTLVFWIVARVYLFRRIQELSPRAIILPILLLHSFRHLGLMFLEPGATYAGIPAAFAYPAGLGDLLAALLAMGGIVAILRRARRAEALLWVFNIAGALDLLAAITLATVYGASAYMGAAYWIPAFWVPALLVTHYILFVVLSRHRGRVVVPDLAPRTAPHEQTAVQLDAAS